MVDSLGFTRYTVIQFANGDCFISFLSNCYASPFFFFFFYLIAWANASMQCQVEDELVSLPRDKARNRAAVPEDGQGNR